MPWKDKRDQFVRCCSDCHRVFHVGHGTQDMFEFGGFDASAIDLQLAPFAADDPQQAEIVELNDISRRENSNAGVVRIGLGRDDGAVLPVAEQNIRAFDQEFAALARSNGSSFAHRRSRTRSPEAAGRPGPKRPAPADFAARTIVTRSTPWRSSRLASGRRWKQPCVTGRCRPTLLSRLRSGQP